MKFSVNKLSHEPLVLGVNPERPLRAPSAHRAAAVQVIGALSSTMIAASRGERINLRDGRAT